MDVNPSQGSESLKNDDSELGTSTNSLPHDNTEGKADPQHHSKQAEDRRRTSPLQVIETVKAVSEPAIQPAAVGADNSTEVVESRVSDAMVTSSAPSSTESETEPETQATKDRVREETLQTECNLK